MQKPNKTPPINYGSFLDVSRLMNYKHYFLKRPIAVEHHVNSKTLFDHIWGYKVVLGGWEALMNIKGEVQEEAIQVFWTNIHESNLNTLIFHTEVYGV